MTYYANFRANNGTHLIKNITGTNKAKLIATISRIANAERFQGNKCSWQVWNKLDKCVAAGYTLPSGQRCRVHGNDLRYYDEDR